MEFTKKRFLSRFEELICRHMVQRRQFSIILGAALAGAAIGCRPSSRPGLLRVGMDLGYPPFEMQNASGRPDGVSVKLAEELAAYLSRQLEIVPMDFSGLIPALKTGNIDLIISSMTATEERRKSISFSEPYAFTGLALLVNRNSQIQTVGDLNHSGLKVAVKAGTTGDTWALANLPQTQRVVFEDPAACVMEVSEGRVDAFIYDQLSVLRYAGRHPEKTRGILTPFVTESWAIGVAKANQELLTKTNEFLATFREKDGFGKLGEQYLAAEKSQMEAAGIPFLLR